MIRPWLPLTVVMLALAGPAPAAEKAPAGTWKIYLPMRGADSPLWLVQLENKEGSWSGKMLGTGSLPNGEDVPKSTVTGALVRDNLLILNLRMEDSRVSFEGKIPTDDSARILGTIQIGRGITPAILERTTLTTLDKIEVAKEIIANSKDHVAVVRAVMNLVEKAGFLKAKPEDVRGWVDRALKAAEPFGERWQRDVLLDLVEKLNEQDGMAQVALPYAQRAERMLAPKDRATLHRRTLDLLAAALERSGKADDAKEVKSRLAKIDLSVRPQNYPGRAAKSNRVAVFEIFTGAECPPCVAADLAFDALLKTFKPSEVVLLQYHEHIPGPDPLTTAQTESRFRYYAQAFQRAIRGTPAMLINGAPGTPGGGRREDAQDKYDEFYDALASKLDDTAKVALTLKAERKGDKIEIAAKVSDSKETGDSIKLRLVLIEDVVDYKGSNGLEKHHHVVRGFPGGVEGVAIKAKDLDHKATVELDKLKKEITTYLTDFYKKAEEELPKNVPLELKKLKVVALVQDDNTREILNAIQVDVDEAK